MTTPDPFARARRARGPHDGSLYDPATLDEAALRTLWRFRLTHIALKEHVDPEADFQTFSTLVRSGLVSWILRAEDGAVRGMAHFTARARALHDDDDKDGRPFVFALIEYIYIDAGHRGGLSIVVAALHALLRCRSRWPGWPIYVGGPGYLGGYLMLCQATEPVWLWGDPDMSPWEARAFAAIAAEFPGWDPATGVVTMKTRPLHPRTTPPRDPRLRALAARYTQRCPRWTEGYTAFCFGPLTPGSALRTLRSSLRRLLNKRRG